MERVTKAVYQDGENEISVDEDVPTFRMDALILRFDCPICGAAQVHKSEPSPAANEQHLCSSCGNVYFLFPVERKDGKKEDVKARVEAQLESVAAVHALASRKPRQTHRVAFAAIYGGTALIPIVLGVLTNIVLCALLFGTVGITTATVLTLVFLAVQSSVATLGGVVGPLLFVYYWLSLYGELDDPDFSRTDFLEYVGNYYNNDPYAFQQ